jgi:hypothetical protein
MHRHATRRDVRSPNKHDLILLLLPLYLLTTPVAEDAAAETPEPAASTARKHLLTDIPEANDDIDTVHIFPDYPDGGFPSGQPLKVLLGFRNNGESKMNVSHIAGSVNSPQQNFFYVLNFTVAEYKVGLSVHVDSPRTHSCPQLKGAWYPRWFQPLHLSSENPVSKFAFKLQLAPLQRGHRGARQGGVVRVHLLPRHPARGGAARVDSP